MKATLESMGIHPTWASCANVDFVGLGIQCYESTSLCQCADQTLRLNNKKPPFWAMVGILKKGLIGDAGMPQKSLLKAQEKAETPSFEEELRETDGYSRS